MKKYAHKDIPKYDELIVPVFEALKQLGGSGTVSEIDEKVKQIHAQLLSTELLGPEHI